MPVVVCIPAGILVIYTSVLVLDSCTRTHTRRIQPTCYRRTCVFVPVKKKVVKIVVSPKESRLEVTPLNYT